MIAIGVNPPTETYPDESEHRSQIARHSKVLGEIIRVQVPVVYGMTVSSTANAVSTSVSLPEALATDIVLVTPRDAAATTLAVSASPLDGSVVLLHASQSSVGVLNLLVTRPS